MSDTISTPEDGAPAADDDVQGHGWSHGAMKADAEDDVTGHRHQQHLTDEEDVEGHRHQQHLTDDEDDVEGHRHQQH